MKTNIVIGISLLIPHLASGFRVRAKMLWPNKLQDFLKCNISGKNE